MKKIFLAVAVVAATMVASCSGNKDKAENAANDTIEVVEDELVEIDEIDEVDGNSVADNLKSATNADSIASYVQKAKAYAQKLINEGKIDEAKAYLAKIEPMVKEKAPQLASTLDAVKAGLDKAPAVAKDAADKAVDNAKDKANAAVDAAKKDAKDKVDAAKQNAKDKADAAKKDARDAVNNLLK